MPDFKSESQEADWWYENRHVVDEMFRDAWPELVEKKPPAVPVTLRLERAQLDVARRLAGKTGIRYQTLLKNLIGAGLRSLERAAAGGSR
jgi:predicted DNA binding CopG/RHH family protein